MFTKSTKPVSFKKGLVLLYVLALVAVLLPAQQARAAGLVWDCNSPNTLSSPGNMRFALDQAGLITFNCDGKIVIPTTYVVTANTTIDGAGHNINIFGLGNTRIFIVAPGVTLTLKNLTVSNGRADTILNSFNHFGGAILNLGGNLSIYNVHFNENFGEKGGAIYNYNNGSVTIQNSFFKLNSTPHGSYWNLNDGGAIYMQDGSLDIKNTSFIQNSAYNGGAIANAKATITIKDSTFDSNFTQPTVNTKVDSEGVVTSVEDATGASGGAIASATSITISNTKFLSNKASYAGGAIRSTGGQLTGSTFTSNKVTSQFGGAIANYGTFQISNTVFSSNQALKGEGGAIYNGNKSTVTLSHSTLKNNKAGESGGAITTRGFYLDISTSTLNNNDGGKQGGAIYAVNGLTRLTNSTVSNNSADKGGAITTEKQAIVELTNATLASDKTYTNTTIYNHAGKITLKNTLIVNYVNSPNCSGNSVVDGGNNLQFPKSNCGMTIPTKDPLLQALANNGGPTLTMALQIGSPAIDTGKNAVCAAGPVYNLDQRGYSRPNDGNLDNIATCDIGAYEMAALAYDK